MITGVLGKAESVDPPNNNGYERTLKWTSINQAITALTPFADKTAAGKAGFDTDEGVRVQAVHPEAAEPARRFPFVRGLTPGVAPVLAGRGCGRSRLDSALNHSGPGSR